MANEKELNPSPAEVEGEFKQVDVDARLGQEWGTLSPNPALEEKLEKGEHGIGTPTNPNFNDKVEPEPIKTKNEVIRLIQQYGGGGGEGMTQTQIQNAINSGNIETSVFVNLTCTALPNASESIQVSYTEEQYSVLESNTNSVLIITDSNDIGHCFYRTYNGYFETTEGSILYRFNPSSGTPNVALVSATNIQGSTQINKTVTENAFTVTADEFTLAVNNENVILVLRIGDYYYSLSKTAVDSNGVTFSSNKYIAKFNRDGANYTGTVEEVANVENAPSGFITRGGFLGLDSNGNLVKGNTPEYTRLYQHSISVWVDSEHTTTGVISFFSNQSEAITDINYLIFIENKFNYNFDSLNTGQMLATNKVLKTSYQGDHLVIYYESFDSTNLQVTYVSSNVYGIVSDNVNPYV